MAILRILVAIIRTLAAIIRTLVAIIRTLVAIIRTDGCLSISGDSTDLPSRTPHTRRFPQEHPTRVPAEYPPGTS